MEEAKGGGGGGKKLVKKKKDESSSESEGVVQGQGLMLCSIPSQADLMTQSGADEMDVRVPRVMAQSRASATRRRSRRRSRPGRTRPGRTP